MLPGMLDGRTAAVACGVLACAVLCEPRGAFAQAQGNEATALCGPDFAKQVAALVVLRDGREPSEVDPQRDWDVEFRFELALVLNDFLVRFAELKQDAELPIGLKQISARRVRYLRDSGRVVPAVCDIVGFMHGYYQRPKPQPEPAVSDRERSVQSARSEGSVPPRPEPAAAPAATKSPTLQSVDSSQAASPRQVTQAAQKAPPAAGSAPARPAPAAPPPKPEVPSAAPATPRPSAPPRTAAAAKPAVPERTAPKPQAPKTAAARPAPAGPPPATPKPGGASSSTSSRPPSSAQKPSPAPKPAPSQKPSPSPKPALAQKPSSVGPGSAPDASERRPEPSRSARPAEAPSRFRETDAATAPDAVPAPAVAGLSSRGPGSTDPSPRALEIKQEIEALLKVPVYLTLSDLRRQGITMTDADLGERRRNALEARERLIALLEDLSGTPAELRAVHAAFGERGVREVESGLKLCFGDSRAEEQRQLVVRLWRGAP